MSIPALPPIRSLSSVPVVATAGLTSRMRGLPPYRLCRNGCRRDREMAEGVLGRTVYCEANRAFFDCAIERIGNVFNLIHRLESS